MALVAALTLVGAGIRVAVTHGLSAEEIRTGDQAHLSLDNLLTSLAHGGVKPPLLPVIEWCIVRLAGDGDFLVRLPALVAGALLIPVTAWLARELFENGRTHYELDKRFVRRDGSIVWTRFRAHVLRDEQVPVGRRIR